MKYSDADFSLAEIKKITGNVKVTKVDSIMKGFPLLKKGKVDAVICNRQLAAIEMKQMSGLKVLKGALVPNHMAIAFKSGRTALANKVTKTLQKLYKSGAVKKIMKKYSNQGLIYSAWCLM